VSGELLLAIDAATGSCAVAFDINGRQLNFAQREYAPSCASR
jgi:hypothetical protein